MRVLLSLLMVTAFALAGCTSETGGDRDADGLPDVSETQGWLVQVERESGSQSYAVASDPDVQDTDGDGVIDLYELTFGSDPTKADTDDDGLTDCQEIQHTLRAECENPDWEGTTDGGWKTNPVKFDSDGDGLADGAEVEGFTIMLPSGGQRHVATHPLKPDSDGDFLSDGLEVERFGSDPGAKDTDGDGCMDGVDIRPRFEERFEIGLRSFTWHDASGSSDARIRLAIRVADSGAYWPDENGFAAPHDTPVDLTVYEQIAFRPAQCSFTPIDPWLRIDVQAQRMDTDPQPEIDVQSVDVPDGGVSVWWNIDEDVFAWEHPVAPEDTFAAAELDWQGRDGAVSFFPTVVGAPASQGA